MDTDPAISLPLPHRLDIKPNVFKGLTWPECVYAYLIASMVSIGIGLMVGIVIGDLMIALPVWIGGGLILFYVFGSFMARYKHNRPYGYYQQKTYLMLQRFGFVHWYITNSGYRDPRLLNCDLSPGELERIKLERFLMKQAQSNPIVERG